MKVRVPRVAEYDNILMNTAMVPLSHFCVRGEGEG